MGGGGSERQLTYLAAGLHDLGWEVHVAVGRRGPNWPRLERSGAVVHELPGSGAYDWRGPSRLRRLVAEVGPDLIQTWLFRMDVLGGLAAVATRTPWIFSERASALAYPATPRFVFRRVLGGLATAVVANSTAGEAYWRRYAERRFVIPNVVPVDEIDEAPAVPPAGMGLARGGPVVLFAGRFEPQKNIEVLLEACTRLLMRPDVCVVCCGEGSLRPAVDAWLAARVADGRVVVRGHVDELWGFMKSASVLISPALFEGSPNVVLEAMACRTPVVVSDIPEHREILDDASALLVDPRSAERLAAAAFTVLDRPGAAAARAEVARARAARYSVMTVARQYDDIYRQVLGLPGER
jgi:glycosyltransferase involved in cell wall biosynthesis